MKSLENQGFSFFLSYDMIESVTVQRQRNRLEKQRKSGVEKMSRVIVERTVTVVLHKARQKNLA